MRPFAQFPRLFRVHCGARWIMTSDQDKALQAPLNDIERCLPPCVLEAHAAAVRDGLHSYADANTGFTVFTRLAHLKRGKCCGSGCRHCPFNHQNVPAHRKPKCVPPQPTPSGTSDATSTAAASPPPASCEPRASVVAEGQKNAPPAEPSAVPHKATVYTRTGDKGTSALFSGERRSKTDIVFEALGTVDELSSHIGVGKEYLRLQPAANGDASFAMLETIQQWLLDVGTIIATPTKKCLPEAAVVTAGYDPNAWILALEREIDRMDQLLEPMTAFILPGGGLAAAHLHVARSVCRRAERLITAVGEERGDQYGELLPAATRFVNRLSDYLFIAARSAATVADVPRQPQ